MGLVLIKLIETGEPTHYEQHHSLGKRSELYVSHAESK